MPHFTIFEGEAAVRTKNARLEAENRKLKAENERLRAKCGEVAVAEVTAELAAARLGGGEVTGSSGESTFVIGAPAKPVQLNPLIARARAGKAAAAAPAMAPAMVAPVDLPASTQPQQEVDEQAASQRFSLIELNR